MENSKATVNIYDYGQKKKKRAKVFMFFSRLFETILGILILLFVIFVIYKYMDNDSLAEIDKMAAYSVRNLYNYVENNDIGESKVIYFPDNENIVGSNGLIYNDLGIDIKQFEEGYIIMYKDGKYSYDLKYNGYCLKKELDEDKYSVNIFNLCNPHRLDDLKG